MEAAWARSWERAHLSGEADLDEAGVPAALGDLLTPSPLRSVWVQRERVAALRRWWALRGARGARVRAPVAVVVAACRLTHRLGAPLADVLEMVASAVDEAEEADRVRRSATAGPRSSARLLGVLPLLAMVGAHLVGASPFRLLTDGGVGTACLVLGLVTALFGQWVMHGMLRSLERRLDHGRDAALQCDLMRAALDSGAAVPEALAALGEATGEPGLRRVARALLLGMSWDEAWRPLPVGCELVHRTLAPAWEDGASPTALLERAAAQLRSRRASTARAEAESLGVRMVLPLGLLLLPSFIALGVVPVVLHVARDSLGPLA